MAVPPEALVISMQKHTAHLMVLAAVPALSAPQVAADPQQIDSNPDNTYICVQDEENGTSHCTFPSWDDTNVATLKTAGTAFLTPNDSDEDEKFVPNTADEIRFEVLWPATTGSMTNSLYHRDPFSGTYVLYYQFTCAGDEFDLVNGKIPCETDYNLGYTWVGVDHKLETDVTWGPCAYFCGWSVEAQFWDTG